MKKLILAATILVLALGSRAQEQQTHAIQVNGMAKIDREVEAYLIDFSLAVEYGESDSKKTFEDLKTKFFTKAKEAGLNESQFEEDKMAFQALQLFREGSLYTFKARSREELLKAVRLANGTVINITGSRIKFKPLAKDEKHFETAFLNGKDKAAVIAKAINKKLGPVLTVTDLTPLEVSLEESFYFKPVADQYIYLSVSFAIE
jgi:predicted small secreted protein